MTEEQVLSLIPREDFDLPDGRALSIPKFMEDLRKAHADGYSITSALADEFTCCLAAPVLDRKTNLPVATVCFVVPISSSQERKAELVELLKASSRVISAKLGDGRVRAHKGGAAV
jgi:DNA-binding IclR family transcriptional regulator